MLAGSDQVSVWPSCFVVKSFFGHLFWVPTHNKYAITLYCVDMFDATFSTLVCIAFSHVHLITMANIIRSLGKVVKSQC